MPKYKISRSYYDGKDLHSNVVGLINAKDLESFVSHLKHCGYEGQLATKWCCFTATLAPGRLESDYGNCTETIVIEKMEKPKMLSPENWGEVFKTFEERGLFRNEEGTYVWRGKDVNDSEEEHDGSDPNDGY